MSDVGAPALHPVAYDDQSPIPPAACWSTMHDLFNSIFEALSLPWAREFLFESSVVSDAQILSSPLQMHHTTSMYMRGAFEAFGPNSECRLNVLHVPAFCCENYTAMFVIEGYTSSNIPKDIQINFVSRPHRFVRGVRNDLTGAITCISKDPESGSVEIGFFSCESTVKFMRVLLRFDGAKFFNAFDVSTGNISFELVENALTSTLITSSVSRCVLCFSDLSNKCNCQLKFKAAGHPLNFESHSLHLLSFLGDFHNHAKFTAYGLSGKTSVTVEGYSTTVSGTSFGVAENLHKWAVCSLVSTASLQPLRLCFPDGGNPENETYSAFGIYNGPDETGPGKLNDMESNDVIDLRLHASEDIEYLEDPEGRWAWSENPATVEPAALALDFVDEIANSNAEGTPQTESGRCTDFPGVNVPAEGKLIQPDLELANNITQDQASNHACSISLSVTSYAAKRATQNIDQVPIRHRRAYARIAPGPAPAPILKSPDESGATVVSAVPGSTAAAQAYFAKLEREYAERMEIRKLKKREAAARSNARRSLRRLQERQKRASNAKT